LKPFWNLISQGLSKEFWIPSSDNYINNTNQKSWYTNICCDDNNDKNNISKHYPLFNKKKTDNTEEQFTATKLRIYPNKEQKQTLEKWFGASRFIYNNCLSYINDNSGVKGIMTIKNLRTKFVNNENFTIKNKWMIDIPYDIRDEAVRDLKKNYKSNFVKKNNGNNNSFDIKYKSKKLNNSINVLSKHWNHKSGIYSDIFSSQLKCKKKLPAQLDHTSRIFKNRLGHYYICIPKLIENKKQYNNIKEPKGSKDSEDSICENQTNKSTEKQPIDSNIVSIDPGVRTFLTCYDPKGKVIKIGHNDIGLLARLLHYKYKLQSKISKSTNHKNRYSLQRAQLKLNLRIKNLVFECHTKTAKWLCSNYNAILIPKLNFQGNKNISRKNRAKLLVWNHCSFVDRLVEKSRLYDCNVIEVTEEYTSKTCGSCGHLKIDLKAERIFNCDNCKNTLDRDINGARNIMLKYITENKSL
jgi:IS605 OrfB family transposase